MPERELWTAVRSVGSGLLMAISRTEADAMDPDELIEALVDLSATVENVRAVVDKNLTARKELESTVDEVLNRLDELEAENERLQARIDSGGGKAAKVGQIVRYADNAKDSGSPAIKLTAKEIQGATGCSRRYAYDLMDDLPDEYDWFLTPQEMRQYGSIQIDNADERRLGIDFEGVHSTGCPVNKFTTSDGQEAGSE